MTLLLLFKLKNGRNRATYRVKSSYFGTKGSTAVVATGPYTSYPTNFSAVEAAVLFYRQCMCFCQFWGNIVAYRAKVSKPYLSFNLHIVYIT
jgi:hypothetical protein